MITVSRLGGVDNYTTRHEVYRHILRALYYPGMHDPEVTEVSDVRVVLKVKNRTMDCAYTDIFEGLNNEIAWVIDSLVRAKVTMPTAIVGS